VPPKPPVRQYWSAVLYDFATHALIRDMPYASRSSQADELAIQRFAGGHKRLVENGVRRSNLLRSLTPIALFDVSRRQISRRSYSASKS